MTDLHETSAWTSQEWERPAFTLRTEVGWFHLTPENTEVHRFEENSIYDCAFHLTSNKGTLVVFLEHYPPLNLYLKQHEYEGRVYEEPYEEIMELYSRRTSSAAPSLGADAA